MKYEYLAFCSENNEYINDTLILEESGVSTIDYRKIDLYLDTKLKDYNGKSIYEGSILNFGKNKNYNVKFKNGMFGIEKEVKISYYNEETEMLFYSLYEILKSEDEVIVIGHITNF